MKKETWEKKMNKKGGEKWLSVWWFFVLVVIGGAIVVGVLIYYNANVNIKEIEADILAERIVRCLTDRGYLKQEFLDETFDVFKNCSLKKEVFQKGSNFYFKISVQDRDGNLLRRDIIEGDLAFEKECEVEIATKAKHFPRCSYKNESVFYFSEDGKKQEAKLKITAGSNQEIKKVQIV